MSLQSGFSIPHEEEEEEDRISDLPDSLLHHILSFLPIKDAGITSLLSKRWKPLWLLQLIIYMDEKHCRDEQLLGSFVAARDKNLPFLSVHLKWCPSNEIVYAAMQRRLYNPSFKLLSLMRFLISCFVMSFLFFSIPLLCIYISKHFNFLSLSG